MQKLNVAIFASGEGTNAQSLWRFARSQHFEIAGLICDREGAAVLEKARNDQLKFEVISRPRNYAQHFDLFEGRILEILKKWNVETIFLAGFMAILSPRFLQHFKGEKHYNIINIHPSLLPQYPGAKAYEKAFQDKNSKHGITVHYIDEDVDHGPIIEQLEYKVSPDWDLQQFIAEGKKRENELYQMVFDRLVIKRENI